MASDSGQRPTLEPSRLHELRNALMAAEAAAHGLRSGPRTLMQVTTLLDGLTDALATVRALATDVGVPVAPVSVGTFEVADVLRGQVAVALAGGVDIRLVGAVDAEVRACRRRFAQVLENLLSNARRHGRAADGRVVVDVEVTACPDLVLVSVRDRGPGVPAALATCLRRGAQPLPVPDDPHGLGLALSVRMARAMGGDLWYEVRPGGGACLLLSLPRAAGAVLDEPQQVVQVPEARHDLSLVVGWSRRTTTSASTGAAPGVHSATPYRRADGSSTTTTSMSGSSRTRRQSASSGGQALRATSSEGVGFVSMRPVDHVGPDAGIVKVEDISGSPWP